MCGIIGGTNNFWDYTTAVDALRHRGPDDKKIVSLPDVTLGFCRLSIIDLSPAANQPMSVQNEDVWIVFNGEIYGHRSLRKDLVSKGHVFKTASDTEVILNAYIEWGDQFIEHLDGMFAICIYDKRSNELKLYRDRMGIKPLYYFYDHGQFAFSSELKGLTTLLGEKSLDVDPTAVYDYLTYLYIPEPKSFYKNIFKLLPAHNLVFDLKEKKITSNHPYWRVDANPDIKGNPSKIEQYCRTLRELINESVQDQMIADVPVGFFLSGGLDSSSVVASAATMPNEIKTFSISFQDDPTPETMYAEQVAKKFKTQHFSKILTSLYTEIMFPNIKEWFDEPFADTSAFPTFLVSEYAKNNVTVVLTGDGGDEIFGGYTWYKTFQLYEQLRNIPFRRINTAFFKAKKNFAKKTLIHKIFNKAELYSAHELEFYAKIRGGMTGAEKEPYARLLNIPKNYDSYWHYKQYYRPELPTRTRLQYLDFHTYLPGDILTKVDRTSMTVSLEARVPLLSKKIIEYCFSLPEEIRYWQGSLKGLLKKAMSDLLPLDIIQRPKRGFSIPKNFLDQADIYKQEKILNDLFSIKP